MRLSGGLSSKTRQCEGVTRLSLICADCVAEGMTLLVLVGDDGVTAMLPQGAPVRVRATPGVGPLVCRPPLCRSEKSGRSHGGHGVEGIVGVRAGPRVRGRARPR